MKSIFPLQDNYVTTYDEKPQRRKSIKSHSHNHMNTSNGNSNNINKNTNNNESNCNSNSIKSNSANHSNYVFPVKTKLEEHKDSGFEITTKCKGIKKIKVKY